jgi:hypothetical protein
MVDQFFLNSDIMTVDAATVGIGSERWKSIPADEANPKRARDIMREHRFDVLPIEPESGPVDSYYGTETWGEFGSVRRQQISYDDILPFRRNIRSVIEELADKETNFSFLTQGQEVVGLLTVSNLNCRPVRVYLFGLITEMETGLAKIVENGLDEGTLNENYVLGKMRDHLRMEYQQAKKEGVDESITEYLHLSDLIEIISENGLYESLGYRTEEEFAEDFESLRNFRNSIAHPVRSLEGTDGSPAAMWKNVEICEQSLFHLHNRSTGRG